MRRLLVPAIAAVGLAIGASSATAAPFTLGPTSVVSGLSPFSPGCGGAGEASAGSVLYQNAEVETHVAVNPTNANNVVAYWQQDRWSTVARTATSPATRSTAAGRGRTARRASPAARAERGSATPATISGQRTRGSRSAPTAVCTPSGSCSTTRRRATRSLPRSLTTAGRPGAHRGSFASTTRARLATTSTTRRHSPRIRSIRRWCTRLGSGSSHRANGRPRRAMRTRSAGTRRPTSPARPTAASPGSRRARSSPARRSRADDRQHGRGAPGRDVDQRLQPDPSRSATAKGCAATTSRCCAPPTRA